MNILVTIDNKIVDKFKDMIQSIKLNNDCELNIFVMYINLTKKNIKDIEDFINSKKIGNVQFIKFTDKLNVKMNLKHTTITTYLRLFAPFYLDDYIDRILYLDYDIVCTKDIREFYYTEFDGKAIVGCTDFLESLGNKYYINAGVLLIDLHKYREIMTKEVLIEFINENGSKYKYQDQTVLNLLFQKDIKLVNITYNYQINSVKEEYDHSAIVHYVSADKPWLETYNQPIKAIPYYNLLKNIGKEKEAIKLSEKHFENEYKKYYSKNKKRDKTVDIIMPSYNATKTICKTLDSIVGQKLDGIKTTVLLIDDASDEDYKPIVKKYKDKLNIKYYRMDKNSGVALARQRGIDEGDGDFFTIIDSDDYFISPYAIITLYNAMMESNADVVRSIFVEEFNWDTKSYKLYRHDNIACHGKLYRKEFIKKHNITYLDMRGNEDTAYNALLKACDAKYYDINVMTYRWCYNKESFTRKDKMYHEKDLLTFAHGFVWTANEIYNRKLYLNNIDDKIAELIAWVYSRIYECWYKKTFNSMIEDTANVYLIYRKVTGQNIIPKIEKYLGIHCDKSKLYFFLDNIESKMYKLKEYKKLTKEEKKNLSILFLDNNKKESIIINDSKELKKYAEIGKRVNISYPIKLDNFNGRLIISDDVSIGSNLTVSGDSDIIIQNKSIIEEDVKITTNGKSTNPKLRDYTYTNSVTIGENTYIGCNVIISPGVKIGNNTYIENGSVVLDSIDSNSVARGNPCTISNYIGVIDDNFYNYDKKINWDEINKKK